MRQWSTLHPEFAFLPRKFKIAITGATNDRAAVRWHDVGLHLIRNAAGELGFKVFVGCGMGRTPVISTLIRDFLPWHQIINYLEAVVRVYNRWGRRDNLYKARIKGLQECRLAEDRADDEDAAALVGRTGLAGDGLRPPDDGARRLVERDDLAVVALHADGHEHLPVGKQGVGRRAAQVHAPEGRCG